MSLIVKSIILASFLIISTASCLAKGGSGVSGGGIGILLSDGTVKLADLYEENKIITIAKKIKSTIWGTDKNKILQEKIYNTQKKRFVKEIFEYKSDFFSCAIEKFEKSEYDLLHDLISELLKVEPHLTEFRFKFFPDKQTYHAAQKEFPYQATHYTPEIPKDRQVSLAYYNQGKLFIQKRFYETASDEDKCALAVHEAFRLLSSIHRKISDEEVVILTKYFMNKKLNYDEQYKLTSFPVTILGGNIESQYIPTLATPELIRSAQFEENLPNWPGSGISSFNYRPYLKDYGKANNGKNYIGVLTQIPEFQKFYQESYEIVDYYNNIIAQGFVFDALKQKFVAKD